jgi:uncharacterized protein (TIGR04222 family)
VLRAAKPAPGSRLPEVRAGAAHELDRNRHILTGRGLLIDADRAQAARVFATVAALSVPIVGAIKIAVGVSRGRPVEFLVIASILSTILALAIFARPLRRTRRGDRVLERLTSSYQDLRRLPRDLGSADVSMAVALFGMAALAHTPLAPLRRALEPQHQQAASYGSTCGAGCGGGGGSSCGSSCGGGGCGGCGGS